MIFTALGPLAAYRMHLPKWAAMPVSGAGAAVHGGRANRPGTHALYLARADSKLECCDSVTTIHARSEKRRSGLGRATPDRVLGNLDSGINPGINLGIKGVTQGPVSLVESPHDDPFVPRALGFEPHQREN
jgi:hypothetical protein